MSKTETVKVTLELPKQIVDFLQKWSAFMGSSLENFIEVAVKSEVHIMLKSEAIFDTPWSTTEQVIKTHRLTKCLTT